MKHLHINPDMPKAALIRQDSGRLRRALPDRSKSFGRNSTMTHAAPSTIEVPLDELRSLVEEAHVLAARFGLLYEALTEDDAPAPSTSPSNVYHLASYRQAVQR